MAQKALDTVSKKSQIRTLLQGPEFKAQISRVLPRAMSPERFARIALTATQRNPKLLECTQESLFQCLLDLSAIGLEPDGRRAHLIPFGDKCTLIIDYKGIVEILRRNGDISYLHCDVVGENDQFTFSYGRNGQLIHHPNVRGRGKIYAAYSFIRTANGVEEWEVMSVDEIEAVRKRSRSATTGPWVSDWNEMAKKTVFRRHSKTLPLSAESREAIEKDDELDQPESIEQRFMKAKAAVVASTPGNLSQAPKSEELEEPSLPARVKVQSALAESQHSEQELMQLLHSSKMLPTHVKSIAEMSEKEGLSVMSNWTSIIQNLNDQKQT
jgi:recombination protein RecT